MSELRILNLGAGVQSTDLYLRAAHGEIPPFDYAICSDTQDEFGAEHRRRGEPDDDLFGGEPTITSVTTGRHQKANWRVHFPFIEDGRQVTRVDCKVNLRRWVPYEVEGSACIMCPFKDDPTWHEHMQEPTTRAALIQIDHGIREPGAIVNRNLDQKLYLHRACRPIEQIDFGNERQHGFVMECEGGCGL